MVNQDGHSMDNVVGNDCNTVISLVQKGRKLGKKITWHFDMAHTYSKLYPETANM
jgi:hypothetical protein